MFANRGFGKLLLAGVVLMGIGTSQAEAFGFGHGYGYGYAPGYQPCATVQCNPCGGYGQPWGYQTGPIRRLVHGVLAWRPFYQWSNPGYYGSPYRAASSYGYQTMEPGCCQTAQSMTTLDVPTDATPVEAPSAPELEGPLPGPASDATPAPEIGARATSRTNVLPVSTTSTPATSGLLTIWVPLGAKVTINGHETTSSGSQREYMSNGLRAGFTYNYEIHATIVRDGREVEEVRAVTLTAGQRKGVAFGFNETNVEKVAWVW